jgi:DNA-binding CsgD family transcriptional regulator
MLQNALNSQSNQAACQPPSRLSRLVQQLIIEAKDQALLSSCELDYPKGSDIILDFEFDGIRCVLSRLQPLESRDPVTLSPRELEIVRMVAKGHPNKVIAGVLNISSWTVCMHLRRIFAKLGVVSRAAMVA